MAPDKLLAVEVVRILCFLHVKEKLTDETLKITSELFAEVIGDSRFNKDTMLQTIESHMEKNPSEKMAFIEDKLEFPLLLTIVLQYDFDFSTKKYDLITNYLFQTLNLIIKADGKVTPIEESVLKKYNNMTRYHTFIPAYKKRDIVKDIDNIYKDFFGMSKSLLEDNMNKLKDDSPKENSSSKEKKQENTAVVNTPPEEKKSLEELMEELNKLVGLNGVKSEISGLVNLLKVEEMRKQKGMPIPDKSLHLVFTGNPGTGKTTIARILAKIFYSLGILEKGNLVETDRAGLVAGYVGQTAMKTLEVCKSALGGVLFIDEAYALSYGAENDFGREAIDTLLKYMEDNRKKLIVIVAGYTGNMKDFINKNPGLQSRFNRYIEFPDYTPDELMQIFDRMLKNAKMKLTDPAREKLMGIFKSEYDKRDEKFGNGRFARNMFEKIYANQANRIVKITDLTEEILCSIEPDDIISQI